MKLSNRSDEKEWMDLGPSYYSEEDYRMCHIQLDQIGRYLGGNQATFWAFKQLQRAPESILDVGCGGGLFAIAMSKKFPQAKVVGVDISEEAISFAKEQQAALRLPNLSFTVPTTTRLNYAPQSFDVVTATLVCHHLTDDELVLFLKDTYQIAMKAVILNDLHRHPLTTMSYALATPFLNRMVVHDGFISIRRGFKYPEWVALLEAAGIPPEQYSISWHWAFRWIVLITPQHQ